MVDNGSRNKTVAVNESNRARNRKQQGRSNGGQRAFVGRLQTRKHYGGEWVRRERRGESGVGCCSFSECGGDSP